MVASLSCPYCGSDALFCSRRRREDGLRRLLFFSALRCNGCGRRHFRINAWVLAALVAVALTSAAFIGVGEVIWAHVAQQQAPPIASAQAVIVEA